MANDTILNINITEKELDELYQIYRELYELSDTMYDPVAECLSKLEGWIADTRAAMVAYQALQYLIAPSNLNLD